MPIAKTFTSEFKINPLTFIKACAFDPILNYDTRLFIDPLLLPLSKSTDFSDQASDLFQKHFSDLFRVMIQSEDVGDPSWKAAGRLLQFPEIRFTCLGYGKESTRGSSFGKQKEALVLSIASSVARVGVKDPYILPLYSLLEKDIGPDLISDMTTNVVLPAICDYTTAICEEFEVPMDSHTLKGVHYQLPTNQYDESNGPVLLVPMDVLKELPVASSWEEAVQMAWQNNELRDQLNRRLGEIFRDTALSEEEKRKARVALIGADDAFELFANFLKNKSTTSYDFNRDPGGLMLLQRLASVLPTQIPLEKIFPETVTDDTVEQAVNIVVQQFQFLVEHRGYWKELWNGEKPSREAVAQRLFFAVAFAYIEAHGIDLSPEPDMGNGLIDFKASQGSKKVIVEIKKSSNSKVVRGLENQLVAYCLAERSQIGIYLVLDYGDELSPKNWHESLIAEANELRAKHGIALEVIVIDASKKPSPSKAK